MSLRAVRAAVALLCATAVAVLPASPAHADRIRNDQWHLRYLKVAEVHKISQGEGVIVAVIDTGVDPHPDLRNNLLSGTDVVPGGTGDGRQDQESHGTGMAGLIAAHGHGGNNGALGVAPKAKILPVRDETPTKTGNADHLAAGIRWAIANGAQVVNISSAGGPSPKLREAVQAAVEADVVVVAGAGNKPTYIVPFPAAYEGVVAVGATDRNGNHAEISVPGKQVMISAPGVDIYSTSYNGKYRKGTGTSDSTAIVSGAVALIRSKYPELSAAEVIHRLTATAVDKGKPGRDDEYGYGVLDLVAALTADVPPLKSDTAPSASASADPSPTATDAAALPPARPGGSPTGMLLIGAAVLVAIGVVIALLVVRSRRQPTA